LTDRVADEVKISRSGGITMWKRKAAFAGTFYPADSEERGKLID
jgi:hypothetical protein